MTHFRTFAAPLLVALWLGAQGCAGASRPEPVERADERASYEAALALRASDPAAAEAQLIAFAAAAPNSALADDAALELATLAEQRGDRVTALDQLRQGLRANPKGNRAAEIQLAIARLEAASGNTAAARAALANLSDGRLSESARRDALRLRIEVADGEAERLRWQAALLASLRAPEDKSERGALDREIDRSIAALDETSRQAVLRSLGDRPPAARIHLLMAEEAISASDLAAAEREIKAARELAAGAHERSRTVSVASRVDWLRRAISAGDALPSFAAAAKWPEPSAAGATGTLGVALPLTGPFASYGEACLKGALLAAQIFSETPASPGIADPDGSSSEAGVRIVVRDTGGSAETAAAAVRELAGDEDLSAIVGPLLSSEADGAARAAVELQVPLLSLSSKDQQAGRGDVVFRLGTSPSDEVRQVVSYAVDTLGAKRFAILYPRDAYGRGMRERFWQEVDARGLHVVAVSSYDPNSTDFAAPIRALAGYRLLTRGEQAALDHRADVMRRARRLPPLEAAAAREAAYAELGPEGDQLPPVVDFDALFIPDGHDKVVLIAPQLAFHEVTGVRLLGTGAWDDPDLIRIGRDQVRGAVFSTPFYRDSEFPFAARFVEHFTATYGTPPDRYAAQAYDATLLALVQLATGRATRERMREGLLATRAFPGATGITAILPDGNARKRPYLLGVSSSGIVPLD